MLRNGISGYWLSSCRNRSGHWLCGAICFRQNLQRDKTEKMRGLVISTGGVFLSTAISLSNNLIPAPHLSSLLLLLFLIFLSPDNFCFDDLHFLYIVYTFFVIC